MKNWFLLLLGGWATVTVGLFLATVAGTVVEEQFAISGNGRQLIQAAVMSMINIPIIIYLYQRLYKITGKPKKPVYSLKRAQHFFTGFFLAVALSVGGLFLASAFGLVEIEQWHAPEYWIGALLLNMFIAFFYEALPEELALRGFVYDVLRHRLVVWLSVLVQTLIFIAVAFGVLLLQVITGIETVESIFYFIPQMFLLFFFGIALALIRIWTKSLWAAIGFHLGYLVMARFFIMPTNYERASPIVTFQDTIIPGTGAMFVVMVTIFGAILLLLILLSINFLWRRMKDNGSSDDEIYEDTR